MLKLALLVFCFLIAVLGSRLGSAVEAQPAPELGGWKPPPELKPLIHAHAHNDYAHPHPLVDALDHRFCSVEADIFLVNGELLVAHNRSAVRPGRTLQSLYLDPLQRRIKQNGGRVYPGGPECTLLIDIKSDWHALYPVLRGVLARYADILTTFSDGRATTNALRVIISGNRSLEMFEDEKIRYAAFDGNLEQIESKAPASLMPWISANWFQSFHWQGKGSMPLDEKSRLKGLVEKAHAHGRKLRFWGAPDQPNFWREMLDDGVDLINTDDLAGLQRFFELRAKGK
ncbi:MAG TPA: phosphatidylinositol-specific phospholipase C/glycerophosphodiester phosphodiesterase family protein [Verrucomicrobiae bacterium]|nr:phosphatidylinositol-specific phospholipase C/glycerophosphodiester phosphodiesterase family protein [Verrucomicrobiae bacterium]